jgi:deoxycytidylate deaminase
MPKLDVKRIQKSLKIPSSTDELFLNILFEISSMSTGRTRRQGAILVKNEGIIGTGCFEAYLGEVRPTGEIEIGSGAIENAIATCAKNGVSTNGSILYTYTFPNAITCRLIAKAGISEIRYVKMVENASLGINLCKEKNIKVILTNKMS